MFVIESKVFVTACLTMLTYLVQRIRQMEEMTSAQTIELCDISTDISAIYNKEDATNNIR